MVEYTQPTAKQVLEARKTIELDNRAKAIIANTNNLAAFDKRIADLDALIAKEA